MFFHYASLFLSIFLSSIFHAHAFELCIFYFFSLFNFHRCVYCGLVHWLFDITLNWYGFMCLLFKCIGIMPFSELERKKTAEREKKRTLHKICHRSMKLSLWLEIRSMHKWTCTFYESIRTTRNLNSLNFQFQFPFGITIFQLTILFNHVECWLRWQMEWILLAIMHERSREKSMDAFNGFYGGENSEPSI